MLFNTGTPRLATLDPAGSGAKTASFFLPVPNNDGVKLEWVEKSDTYELIDGSEGIRLFGWIPELTITWDVYDDINPNYGYVIGSASGNQLDYTSLLTVLNTSSGFLKVSPGPDAGGFVVNKSTISAVGNTAGGMATGVDITFRGSAICSSRVLGAF